MTVERRKYTEEFKRGVDQQRLKPPIYPEGVSYSPSTKTGQVQTAQKQRGTKLTL